jgi:hypothetical protein
MAERCVKCILPNNLPYIEIDENGICNYCNSYEKAAYSPSTNLDIAKLEKILSKYRGKGQYDCLIGLSGGKDSTFILFLAVKKFGMRPLTFNLNAGYTSEDATNNIQNVTRALNVDLITFSPAYQDFKKLQSGFLTRVGEFCTPCLMLIDNMSQRIAKNFGIKLIISGSADEFSTSIEGISISNYYDTSYFNTIARTLLGKLALLPYQGPSYLKKAIGRLTGFAPRIVNLLSYTKTPIPEIIDTCQKELPWKKPLNEIQHGDCILDGIKDYLVCKRWGCSEHSQLLSIFVRNRNLTRDEALKKALVEERLKKPNNLEWFLKNIDLNPENLDEFLKNKFTDVPNIRSSRFIRYCISFVKKITS